MPVSIKNVEVTPDTIRCAVIIDGEEVSFGYGGWEGLGLETAEDVTVWLKRQADGVADRYRKQKADLATQTEKAAVVHTALSNQAFDVPAKPTLLVVTEPLPNASAIVGKTIAVAGTVDAATKTLTVNGEDITGKIGVDKTFSTPVSTATALVFGAVNELGLGVTVTIPLTLTGA